MKSAPHPSNLSCFLKGGQVHNEKLDPQGYFMILRPNSNPKIDKKTLCQLFGLILTSPFLDQQLV